MSSGRIDQIDDVTHGSGIAREQMIDKAVRRALTFGPGGDLRSMFTGRYGYKVTPRAWAWQSLVPDIRAEFRRLETNQG